jgi:hypothetical protein
MSLLLSHADVSTICFPKKPIKGGKPTNENIVTTKDKAKTGFVEK